MSLELGEAIVRTGGSKTAHNIKTFPDPPLPDYDPSVAIILNTRQNYARPRNLVEHELRQMSATTAAATSLSQTSNASPPPTSKPPSKPVRQSNAKEKPTEQKKQKKPPYRPTDMWPPGHPNAPKPKPSEPADPSEDDLVT